MKTLFLVPFLAISLAAAQSVSLSVSPSTVQPGGTTTLTLTYTDASPSAGMAGIQFTDGVLPAGVTAGTPVLGAASAAAGKLLTCGVSMPICIIIGNGSPLNENAIGSGVLATIPLTVSASAAAGPLTIALGSVAGATVPGLSMAVSSTPTILTVALPPSKYDLNSDGVVNQLDVSIMTSTLLNGSACGGLETAIGDGRCTLADVELEILAALGVIR